MSPEAVRFIESATPKARTARKSERKGDKGAALLVALARKAGVRVILDPATGRKFSVVRVGPRTAPLDCDSTRDWLAALAVDQGIVPTGSALADAVRAIFAAPVTEEKMVHLRLGAPDLGSRFYYDLGDATGTAVAVTDAGWHLEPSPPVLFARSPATRPILTPVPGGSLEEIGALFGLVGDLLILLIAWMLGALNPRGPYPILCISGEAGAGKSTLTRAIVALLDPQAAALRALPVSIRELAIVAEHSRILAFDNCSTISADLADALCRLATGGGLATRELYSDRRLSFFDAKRPIILNGIPSLLERTDLGDRAILIELQPRPKFRAEHELVGLLAEARPRLLGALFTAASSAIANRRGSR